MPFPAVTVQSTTRPNLVLYLQLQALNRLEFDCAQVIELEKYLDFPIILIFLKKNFFFKAESGDGCTDRTSRLRSAFSPLVEAVVKDEYQKVLDVAATINPEEMLVFSAYIPLFPVSFDKDIRLHVFANSQVKK